MRGAGREWRVEDGGAHEFLSLNKKLLVADGC